MTDDDPTRMTTPEIIATVRRQQDEAAQENQEKRYWAEEWRRHCQFELGAGDA